MKLNLSYTDRKKVCKNIFCFLYGITRSNQFCFCKPDKNEYKSNMLQNVKLNTKWEHSVCGSSFDELMMTVISIIT